MSIATMMEKEIDSLSSIKNNGAYQSYVDSVCEARSIGSPSNFINQNDYEFDQKSHSAKVSEHIKNDQLFIEKLVEVLKIQDDRIENLRLNHNLSQMKIEELEDKIKDIKVDIVKKTKIAKDETNNQLKIVREEVSNRVRNFKICTDNKLKNLKIESDDKLERFIKYTEAKLENLEADADHEVKNICDFVNETVAEIKNIKDNTNHKIDDIKSTINIVSEKHIKIIRDIQNRTKHIVPSRIILSPDMFTIELKPSGVNLLIEEKKRWFVCCQQYLSNNI